MLDGRFDPEFYRSLAKGQVPTSDLARDDPDTRLSAPELLIWLASLVAVIAFFIFPLAQ